MFASFGELTHALHLSAGVGNELVDLHGSIDAVRIHAGRLVPLMPVICKFEVS